MRIATLKPGDAIRRKGSPATLVFVERFRDTLMCRDDRCIGLDGPDDRGFVAVSAWDAAHRYERVTESGAIR